MDDHLDSQQPSDWDNMFGGAPEPPGSSTTVPATFEEMFFSPEADEEFNRLCMELDEACNSELNPHSTTTPAPLQPSDELNSSSTTTAPLHSSNESTGQSISADIDGTYLSIDPQWLLLPTDSTEGDANLSSSHSLTSSGAALIPEGVSGLKGQPFVPDQFLNVELPRLCRQLGATTIDSLRFLPYEKPYQLRVLAEFSVTNGSGLPQKIDGIFRIGLVGEQKQGGVKLDEHFFEDLITRRASVGAFLSAHGLTVPITLAYDTSEDNALGRPFDFREIGSDMALEEIYPQLSLSDRIQIAIEVAHFTLRGLSGIGLQDIGLLEPSLGFLAPNGMPLVDEGDVPTEYNLLDGQTTRPLNPGVMPANGRYRTCQLGGPMPEKMGLKALIATGLKNQRRKFTMASQAEDNLGGPFPRLGSAGTHPCSRYIKDIEFAFYQLLYSGLLDEYEMNTNNFYPGGTSASSFRAERVDGLLKISTFTEWDDGCSMPGIMLLQPPTWLWSSGWGPNEKQTTLRWHGNDDFCPPEYRDHSHYKLSDDDKIVKQAYETACISAINNSLPCDAVKYSVADFMEDTYGKGKLARMLVEFAISDHEVSDWSVRHHTFVQCWNAYLKDCNYTLHKLPCSEPTRDIRGL